MSHLNQDALEAAKKHARAEYPKESAGLIVKGEYIPCENIAEDPLKDFEIGAKIYKAAVMTGGLEAVVHSHPDGPFYPTEADMQSQLATDVAWVIIPLDDERIGTPTVWGGDTPIPPVIGREFLHGVTDCYSLIRDFYRLGKDKLAEQGIDNWPFPPIDLPDFARSDEWWNLDGYNFYVDEPPKLGFVEIDQTKVEAGDLFFTKIRGEIYNHAGIYLGNNLIAHHLPTRLSRREPAALWGRQAGKWMRYQGPINAA